MTNNWFTILMSEKSYEPRAAYSLLVSGTLPLDVNERIDGKPVIGWLRRPYSRSNSNPLYWVNLATTRLRDNYIPNWIYPGEPLAISPGQKQSGTVKFPDFMGPRDNRPYPQLQENEAIFAKLLQMGANPWDSWKEGNQELDGFDLAMGMGCLPLIQACLDHPSRPPMETLYKRTPWVLMGDDAGYKTSTHSKFFDKNDTYMHAAAASGMDTLVQLLVDYGWPVNVKTKYTPLDMARSKETTDILLASGAQWNDTTLSNWETWANKYDKHKATLAKRVEYINSIGMGEGVDKLLGQQAIDAFRKSDTSRLSDILRSAAKSYPDRLGNLEDAENPHLGIYWKALPWGPIKLAPDATLQGSPLFAVSLLALSNCAQGKRKYITRQLADYAVHLPNDQLAEGITSLGMAQIMVSLCASDEKYERFYSQLHHWHAKLRKMDQDELMNAAIDAYKLLSSSQSTATLKNLDMAMNKLMDDALLSGKFDGLRVAMPILLAKGAEHNSLIRSLPKIKQLACVDQLDWAGVFVATIEERKNTVNTVFRENMHSALLNLLENITEAISTDREISPQVKQKINHLSLVIEKINDEDNLIGEKMSYLKKVALEKGVEHRLGEVNPSRSPKM